DTPRILAKCLLRYRIFTYEPPGRGAGGTGRRWWSARPGLPAGSAGGPPGPRDAPADPDPSSEAPGASAGPPLVRWQWSARPGAGRAHPCPRGRSASAARAPRDPDRGAGRAPRTRPRAPTAPPLPSTAGWLPTPLDRR